MSGLKQKNKRPLVFPINRFTKFLVYYQIRRIIKENREVFDKLAKS